METFYSLLVMLVGGLIALGIGVRMGKGRRLEPAAPPAPAPEPESKGDDESPGEEVTLTSIASALEEKTGQYASPDAFLSSPAFAEALKQVEALGLAPSDVIGFIRHSGAVRASLAIRHAVTRTDLDGDRLRSVLLDRLEATSLLDRTVVLEALDSITGGPLVNEVVRRLESDWDNGAAVEILEVFLRQRLLKKEELDITGAVKDKDSWDRDQLRDIFQRLPEDLRDPLLKQLPTEDRPADDFRSFLEGFARILPQVKDTLDDGSPLITTPALEAAAEKVTTSLTREEQPRSVLLSGPQGVGKTVLTQLVAKRLQADGYIVIRASAAELMSGQSYIGEIELRVQTLVKHLSERRLVWIADSFHELAVSGRHRHSPTSILDMILPHLQSGAIRVLGETRPGSLERLAQEAPRLDSALDITRFDECPESETLELAAEWVNRHPGRQGSRPSGTSEALAEGLRLCSQFLPAQSRPGNLIDLLKHAFAREADRHPGQQSIPLGNAAFLSAVASISGMPLEIIDESRHLDLDALRRRFDRRVVGQAEAVGALVERVAMIKAGLTDPTRPLGVFLFAGPTGTGKTEIAKALAEFLFGSGKRMIRLDMSEFKNPSSLSRLTGGPDEGQSLASQIRQQPFSLVLLDEFEKADANVWDLFLQVFDDGRLTDAQGNTADLRNAIIILTSNLGAVSAQGAPLGFAENTGPGYRPDAIRKTIEETFRKEFVNRIDRIVCFQPLSRDTMRNILRQQVAQVLLRRGLRRRPWTIEWDPTATEFLLEKGFSPTMGARPLQRAVERYFLSPLSEAIVRGELADDEQLLFIYARDGALRWDSSADPLPETPEEALDDTPAPPTSNRTLILRPAGSEDELRFLLQRQRDLDQLLTLDAFSERKQACLEAMSDPGFWDRPDRFDTLGLAEYIDRIESSLRSTGEFLQRLLDHPDRRPSPERLRALVSRNAERLFLLEASYPEVTAAPPAIDALLAIQLDQRDEESETFAHRLRDMYLAWARNRGMRVETITPANDDIFWLANVSGFGAYHILSAEDGAHHWSEGRRGETSATVLVTAANRPAPDRSGDRPAVVRRYQELPTPLVRDKHANWRTGRLDLVLQGHFDIIGS